MLERLQVRHDHAQQIIGVAGHQIALHHLRAIAYRPLERFERRLDLLLQRDLNEHAHFETNLQRIQERNVAADVTAFLQRTHAVQARRGRQAHLPCEVHIRDAGVELKQVQDLPICCVEFHVQYFLPKLELITAIRFETSGFC